MDDGSKFRRTVLTSVAEPQRDAEVERLSEELESESYPREE